MHTNTASNRSPQREPESNSLADRLRAAADLLEKIVADRSLLADIPEADRNRFLNAAGRVSRPDALGRRQLLKVVKRKKRAEKVQREETVLAATGIRKLRREPVFITSPNIYPPKSGELLTSGEPVPETENPRKCYVCKKEFSTVHHFYDRLCLTCAEENFAKRT
ncbi:MAG TPA: oxidoreductase, partial [Gemmatimonadetes bacterium]|nr:oxidoreductase [Gemmatimonadota bacterium]